MRAAAGIWLLMGLAVSCSETGDPKATSVVPARTEPSPSPRTFGRPNPRPAEAEPPSPTYPVITPVTPVQGRITFANAKFRFVIVDFAFQRMPTPNQRLGVYRDNLRVGELRASGPADGTRVVADVMFGDAAPGDLVREEWEDAVP